MMQRKFIPDIIRPDIDLFDLFNILQGWEVKKRYADMGIYISLRRIGRSKGCPQYGCPKR